MKTRLSRAAVIDRINLVLPHMSHAQKILVHILLQQLDDRGVASVETLHNVLFPGISKASKSANFSRLLRAIVEAASAHGVVLHASLQGAKRDGTGHRSLVFEGDATMLTPSLTELADCPFQAPAMGRLLPTGPLAHLNTPDDGSLAFDDENTVFALDELLSWALAPSSDPILWLTGERGAGKTVLCQQLIENLLRMQQEGKRVPTPIYVKLQPQRLREKLAALAASLEPRDESTVDPREPLWKRTSDAMRIVGTFREMVEQSLADRYSHHGKNAPTYADVLAAIDQGAVLVVDGLDEMLALLDDHSRRLLIENLLRSLTEAESRWMRSEAPGFGLRMLVAFRASIFESDQEQYRAFDRIEGLRQEGAIRHLDLRLHDGHVKILSTLASEDSLVSRANGGYFVPQVLDRLPRLPERSVEVWIRSALERDLPRQILSVEEKMRVLTDLAVWMGEDGCAEAPSLRLWFEAWLTSNDLRARWPLGQVESDLRCGTFLERCRDVQKRPIFRFASAVVREFFKKRSRGSKADHGDP